MMIFLSTFLSLLLLQPAEKMSNCPAAAIIADWTYEVSQPVTAGPISPEVGAGSNTQFHASSPVTYSSPSGNGSIHSYSSTRWSVADFHQFQVSTFTYSSCSMGGVQITFDMASAGTGPGTFNMSCSTDGVTYTEFGSPVTVLVSTWTPMPPPNPAFTFNYTCPTGIAVNNAFYFRISDANTTSASGGVVGVAGTNRVDNVIIQTVGTN